MNKKIIALIVVIAFLLVGGGAYIAKRGEEPTPTPTPEVVAPQEAPTVTPEEADISKFKIKILNGTAVAGLAAKMKTALETAGFTISGTGNADTKDYQQVEVQAKSSVPASILTKLKDAIGKSYTIGSEKTLDDSSEVDSIVILGTKSQPTATPSAKPAATTAPTAGTTITQTPTPTITPTPTKVSL